MGEASAIHVFPLRVYYEDTDAEGIVYYANYLKFAERGRTEMLRAAGVDHRSLRKTEDVSFAVRSLSADYLRPARLDDTLEVHTRLLSVGGASMAAEQIVKRDGADLARLVVRLACVGGNGKPARLPGALRTALAAFVRNT